MDNISDCCNHNILTSCDPLETSDAHTTNSGAQSVLMRVPGPAHEFVLRWQLVLEVATR